jgi:allantoinase
VSELDLIVRRVRLATEPGAPLRDIGVAGGRIVEIAEEIGGGAGEEVDAGGLHVLPGGVDPHVHLDDPGRTHWEGFALGTSALAAGGVTTCVDMPLNASPPTVDAASFDLKLAAGSRASMIDFALWGGLIPGNRDDMDELAARGVVGFKAFMCHGGLEDFPPADDLTLYEGMQRAAALGLLVGVHAENETITRDLTARARAQGRHAMRDWAATRPIVAETEAIRRAIGFAEETGCALHVVHVSTGGGVALVTEARARGVDVTCEVCPHHLILTEEDGERLGMIAKCAPPLRPAAETEAMWAGVVSGEVAMVVSDHSPVPASAKRGHDVFAAWGGIAAGQSTMELLLTEGCATGRLSLDRAGELLAAAAARRFGLPGKGRLEVGYDADLALVDLDDERVLSDGELRQRHSYSPFTGRTLKARVVRTILRGRTISRVARPASAQPTGRMIDIRAERPVAPAPAAAAAAVSA